MGAYNHVWDGGRRRGLETLRGYVGAVVGALVDEQLGLEAKRGDAHAQARPPPHGRARRAVLCLLYTSPSPRDS